MSSEARVKVISIISGKGGTGKSLFTAVLGNCLAKEKCRVLLVDMDLHVRGLTILLSKYMGTSDTRISVSQYLDSLDGCLDKVDTDVDNSKSEDFAFFRFQECEFLPAVIDIVKPLKKDQSSELVTHFLSDLKKRVDNKYDIVLLDCRAGLDDFVVRSVKESDFSISISEDDDVCLQANTNLVTYLRYHEDINNIYTVINKGRRINTVQDIENKINSIFDFSCIGAIPFDEKIMEDYGKDRFWLSVYETLYFYGIVRFWKKFQEKTQLPYKIDEEKYHFGKKSDENRTDKETYEKKEYRKRVFFRSELFMRLYGLLFVLVGCFCPIFIRIAGMQIKDLDLISSILSALGILMVIFSTSSFRRSLLGDEDNPSKLK